MTLSIPPIEKLLQSILLPRMLATSLGSVDGSLGADPGAYKEPLEGQSNEGIGCVHILIIVRSLDAGGAERQLIDLIAGLDKAAFRVTVLCFYRGRWHDRLASVPGVTLKIVGKAGRFDVFGFVYRLLTAAREVQPDVVYGYMYVADVLALLSGAVLGRPVAWGLRSSDLQTGHYDRLSRFLQWLSRRFAHRADTIISNSTTGLRDFVNRGARVRHSVVIPNGIDVDRFTPNAQAKVKTRSKWGVPGVNPLIGIVARIDPMKGHRTFLEAAKRLAQTLPDAWFVCVGSSASEDAEYARSLRAQATRLGLNGRLLWVEHVEQIETVYPALDVCTSTSRYGEGFSNAIGEAMSCGVACVATDVGDSAKIVGDPRLVVPIDDVDRLIEAWLLALRTADELGPRNRARIVEHYSKARCINSTADLFSHMAASHARV